MQIATDRLLLREYVPDDLQALLTYHADSRQREFYGPQEGTPEQLRTLLDQFITWAVEIPRRNYQLAVVPKTQPEIVIGSVGLRQADESLGQALFGIEVAADRRGHGYATEAAKALLDFGFRDLGLAIVRGITVSANAPITRVVRRLGFELVNTMPGPDWMTARGWGYSEWRLTLTDWNANFAR